MRNMPPPHNTLIWNISREKVITVQDQPLILIHRTGAIRRILRAFSTVPSSVLRDYLLAGGTAVSELSSILFF